jgi:hypothetical protein
MPDKPEPFTAETAQLVSVGDFAGRGIATREWDGTAFIHTLTVKAEEPAGGEYYKGRLEDLSGNFIDTGRLSRSGGGYALTFTSRDDLSAYARAVVLRLSDGTDSSQAVLVGRFNE